MNKRQMIGIVILMIIFLFISAMVVGDNQGVLIDRKIMEVLHKETNNNILSLSKGISFLGSAKFIIPTAGIAIIISFLSKKYYVTKILISNSAVSYIINFIVKQIIHRTRPIEFFRIQYSGYSFPSGHSMVTMSLVLTIAFLMTRKKSSKKNKIGIYTISSIYILLMGFSRLYLGVHWPTDVLCGFILGYVIHIISINLIKEKPDHNMIKY